MRVLKIIAAVSGVLALLISAAFVVGGASLLTITGDDGFAELPEFRLTNPAAGVLADDIEIWFDGRQDGFTFVPGDLRVLADIDSDKDVFVGIGPESRVLAYLDEAGVERTRISGDEVRLAVTADLAGFDPAAEDFWLATNDGQTIDWTVTEGDYAVVMVNRDGSAGIDVAIDGAVKVPFLRPIGGGLLGFGILVAATGIVLMYFGLRREDPPAPPAPDQAPAAA